MFSIITMALSITNSVAIVNVISVRLLIEKSRNIIIAKVSINDSGIVISGMMVVGILRKNR